MGLVQDKSLRTRKQEAPRERIHIQIHIRNDAADYSIYQRYLACHRNGGGLDGIDDADCGHDRKPYLEMGLVDAHGLEAGFVVYQGVAGGGKPEGEPWPGLG